MSGDTMRPALLALATWLTACVGSGRIAYDPHEAAAAHGITDSAQAASARHLEPGALATVQAAAVEFPPFSDEEPFEVALRIAEQISGHSRRFGTITMPIALRIRSPDLSQYPCTSCHLGRTVEMRDLRVADAHQNIRPRHPQATGAICSTCHSPDDVQRLAVKAGERPTLDHAYRLCAQCHFAQAEAWAGGGHGKRLDGWQGRRVVMGCADCHDPHDPTTEKRIPFRAPTLPGGGH